MVQPVVMLLHAWPLESTFEEQRGLDGGIGGAGGDEDIPDVEREPERIDAFQALLNAKMNAVLKCLPLNRDTLVEAFRSAHVILLGAHGTTDGGIVIEKGAGGAECLRADSVAELLVPMTDNTTQLVFVSSCYSEAIGKCLVEQCGVEHVICIAENERVSNLVSRAFFKTMLTAVMRGAAVRDAVESGIVCVENHRELSLERQMRQRRKFVYIESLGERHHPRLFDVDELSRSGLAQDLTETSSLFGFRRSEMPRPIFGRNPLIKRIVEALMNRNQVMLTQSESGLGSSLVVHAVCRYLADRKAFDVIRLCESFLSAQDAIQTLDDDEHMNTLIVVDPANWVKEPMAEKWLLDRILNNNDRLPHLLVVMRNNDKLFPIARSIAIEPLDTKSADALKAFLIGELELPKEHLLTSIIASNGRGVLEGNPRRIVSWAKGVFLDQPVHMATLGNATGMTWPAVLQDILQKCVVGPPSLWSRRERRTVLADEVEWIRSVCDKYPGINEFWNKWLKPTIAMLSYIEPFFTNRSVLGFVSEVHTRDVALRGKEPWTFLLRCSEKGPGCLTLSYISSPGNVLEKVSLRVCPDGSVVMPLSTGTKTCRDLNDAVHTLRMLKRVVISRNGVEVLDKEKAFNDLF